MGDILSSRQLASHWSRIKLHLNLSTSFCCSPSGLNDRKETTAILKLEFGDKQHGKSILTMIIKKSPHCIKQLSPSAFLKQLFSLIKKSAASVPLC